MTRGPVPRRVLVCGAVSAFALLGCAQGAADEPPLGQAEASQPALGQDGPEVVVGDVAPIAVEVADDDESRRVGLMGRAEVPSGTGMLFVYDEPVTNAFWMGNVEVDLSIAWVLGDRVVGVAEMQPCPDADDTCPRYSPGAEFDRAVETTGGTFTDAGVRPGDPVSVHGLD